MILPGETEAGSAGTQPCRGISRRAHRDDERGVRARSCAPNLHRIERPHALKIPARRAEYSLTENVASPFQAEPRQSFLICMRAPIISSDIPSAKISFSGSALRLKNGSTTMDVSGVVVANACRNR